MDDDDGTQHADDDGDEISQVEGCGHEINEGEEDKV